MTDAIIGALIMLIGVLVGYAISSIKSDRKQPQTYYLDSNYFNKETKTDGE